MIHYEHRTKSFRRLAYRGSEHPRSVFPEGLGPRTPSFAPNRWRASTRLVQPFTKAPSSLHKGSPAVAMARRLEVRKLFGCGPLCRSSHRQTGPKRGFKNGTGWDVGDKHAPPSIQRPGHRTPANPQTDQLVAVRSWRTSTVPRTEGNKDFPRLEPALGSNSWWDHFACLTARAAVPARRLVAPISPFARTLGRICRDQNHSDHRPDRQPASLKQVQSRTVEHILVQIIGGVCFQNRM